MTLLFQFLGLALGCLGLTFAGGFGLGLELRRDRTAGAYERGLEEGRALAYPAALAIVRPALPAAGLLAPLPGDDGTITFSELAAQGDHIERWIKEWEKKTS